MAAVFESDEKATTGTTPVTLVAAPGASEQKQVLSLAAWNRDTVTRTLIAKKVGGEVTPFEIARATIEANGHAELLGSARCVVLDNTDETITIESDATAATTEPLVHYAGFKVP